MEALGPVLVLVSIPLLFRWVPRNRLYGFRVAATLRDDAAWYDVNARSARHFLLLGSVMVALEFVLPQSLRNEILMSLDEGDGLRQRSKLTSKQLTGVPARGTPGNRARFR